MSAHWPPWVPISRPANRVTTPSGAAMALDGMAWDQPVSSGRGRAQGAPAPGKSQTRWEPGFALAWAGVAGSAVPSFPPRHSRSAFGFGLSVRRRVAPRFAATRNLPREALVEHATGRPDMQRTQVS